MAGFIHNIQVESLFGLGNLINSVGGGLLVQSIPLYTLLALVVGYIST